MLLKGRRGQRGIDCNTVPRVERRQYSLWKGANTKYAGLDECGDCVGAAQLGRLARSHLCQVGGDQAWCRVVEDQGCRDISGADMCAQECCQLDRLA
eukprot:201201-Prymnesium_polylepis.1